MKTILICIVMSALICSLFVTNPKRQLLFGALLVIISILLEALLSLAFVATGFSNHGADFVQQSLIYVGGIIMVIGLYRFIDTTVIDYQERERRG